MYNKTNKSESVLRIQAEEKFQDYLFEMIPYDSCGGKVLSVTKNTPVYENQAAHMTYDYYRAIARKLKLKGNECTNYHSKYKILHSIERAKSAASYIKNLFVKYF